MRFLFRWQDETFDPGTLTLPELERVEQIAGHGFAAVDPTARANDFAALLTVFLLRTREVDDVIAAVAGATLDDISRAVVVTS